MSEREQPSSRCFQGIVPSAITTCAADGTPNITYLSHVLRIDDKRVALSCQFFNKTKQNVLQNPYASLALLDPVSFETWRLELRYDHSETSGALFDAMALRIDVIASHTGMTGVFKLISSDVYEVLACEKMEGFLLPEENSAAAVDEPLEGPRSELRALQLISQRTCRARSLDELVSGVLESLEDAFGFQHSMFLLPDESGARLFTIASRGYSEFGVGAEVLLGEGLIGTVARERRLLRVSGMDVALRYGRAIRASTDQTRARRELRPEIPLPGLPDARSQLALPLLAGEQLIGVLALESREAIAFDEWHEAFLEIVANQVASALESVLLRESHEESAATASAPAADAAPASAAPALPAGRVLRLRFFRNDDCVFIDDEYLIRNVPGRILWKILRAHVDSGRVDFNNRELRLDPTLGLPPLRDNLESRLVLLRKRLEQKCPDLRLISTARGRFRLEAGCALQLEELDGAS